jgi:hypothetical protein
MDIAVAIRTLVVIIVIVVRYHSGGSMELNARILLLAYMVYL